MTGSGMVTAIRRYPVKSMLGEDAGHTAITFSGVEGDRVAALVDAATGMVASAKYPRLWRNLLGFTARWSDGTAEVKLPDGQWLEIGQRGVDDAISATLGRPVRIVTTRTERAVVDRAAPEAVIEAGDDADVPYASIEIGQGTPGKTLVDFAPVHLFTTATLAAAGAELIRYRPNLVLDLPGVAPYAENDWTGREITAGSVVLRILGPTEH